MTAERVCAVCGCTETNACFDVRGSCCWVDTAGIEKSLCSHCAQPDWRRALALRAAERLADVVANLTTFAIEGDQHHLRPLNGEPAENVADALRSVILIEANPEPLNSEQLQLTGAIDRFLEGWA